MAVSFEAMKVSVVGGSQEVIGAEAEKGVFISLRSGSRADEEKEAGEYYKTPPSSPPGKRYLVIYRPLQVPPIPAPIRSQSLYLRYNAIIHTTRS